LWGAGGLRIYPRCACAPFFQIDPNDFTVIFQGEAFAEERYRKSKEFREKKEKEKAE
jgi:hypothetical protein